MPYSRLVRKSNDERVLLETLNHDQSEYESIPQRESVLAVFILPFALSPSFFEHAQCSLVIFQHARTEIFRKNLHNGFLQKI